MPLKLLKLNFGVSCIYAARDARQAGYKLSRFKADSHLIAVILATDSSAVDPGAHLDPQDHACLGNGASFLRCVRVAKPRR